MVLFRSFAASGLALALPRPLFHLAWKDLQTLMAFWIAVGAVGVLTVVMVAENYDSPELVLDSCLIVPAFFVLGCGPLLFAAEEEAGTVHWLRSMPIAAPDLVTSRLLTIGLLWIGQVALLALVAFWKVDLSDNLQPNLAHYLLLTGEFLVWSWLVACRVSYVLRAVVIAAAIVVTLNVGLSKILWIEQIPTFEVIVVPVLVRLLEVFVAATFIPGSVRYWLRQTFPAGPSVTFPRLGYSWIDHPVTRVARLTLRQAWPTWLGIFLVLLTLRFGFMDNWNEIWHSPWQGPPPPVESSPWQTQVAALYAALLGATLFHWNRRYAALPVEHGWNPRCWWWGEQLAGLVAGVPVISWAVASQTLLTYQSHGRSGISVFLASWLFMMLFALSQIVSQVVRLPLIALGLGTIYALAVSMWCLVVFHGILEDFLPSPGHGLPVAILMLTAAVTLVAWLSYQLFVHRLQYPGRRVGQRWRDAVVLSLPLFTLPPFALHRIYTIPYPQEPLPISTSELALPASEASRQLARRYEAVTHMKFTPGASGPDHPWNYWRNAMVLEPRDATSEAPLGTVERTQVRKGDFTYAHYHDSIERFDTSYQLLYECNRSSSRLVSSDGVEAMASRCATILASRAAIREADGRNDLALDDYCEIVRLANQMRRAEAIDALTAAESVERTAYLYLAICCSRLQDPSAANDVLRTLQTVIQLQREAIPASETIAGMYRALYRNFVSAPDSGQTQRMRRWMFWEPLRDQRTYFLHFSDWYRDQRRLEQTGPRELVPVAPDFMARLGHVDRDSDPDSSLVELRRAIRLVLGYHLARLQEPGLPTGVGTTQWDLEEILREQRDEIQLDPPFEASLFRKHVQLVLGGRYIPFSGNALFLYHCGQVMPLEPPRDLLQTEAGMGGMDMGAYGIGGMGGFAVPGEMSGGEIPAPAGEDSDEARDVEASEDPDLATPSEPVPE